MKMKLTNILLSVAIGASAVDAALADPEKEMDDPSVSKVEVALAQDWIRNVSCDDKGKILVSYFPNGSEQSEGAANNVGLSSQRDGNVVRYSCNIR